MKQGLLLIAIYALIINQAKKDNPQKDIPDAIAGKMQMAMPASLSENPLKIDKYAYLDQSAFLITSADNRSFIMLEDGTCYEVVDHRNTLDGNTKKDNSGFYTNAAYKY